ncbi:Uncharacterized membrane protein, partial [Halopenitus malekzadehii]
SYQLLVRLGADKGNTNDALIVILIVNSTLLIPIAIFLHAGAIVQPVAILYFIAAGLSGSMIGRAFNYLSIDLLGASRASPITASNTLMATFLGIVLLNEPFTVIHILGVVAIVVGVGYISFETSRHNPGDLNRDDALWGLAFALLAFVFYGVEPIFAKSGFNLGMPIVSALAIKTVSAGIGFYTYLRIRNKVPKISFSDSNMRIYMVAGLANTIFILTYYAALQIAPVVLVHPVISSYTLFIIVLSYLVMPERLERITIGLVFGALITIVGIIVIGLSPS